MTDPAPESEVDATLGFDRIERRDKLADNESQETSKDLRLVSKFFKFVKSSEDCYIIFLFALKCDRRYAAPKVASTTEISLGSAYHDDRAGNFVVRRRHRESRDNKFVE